MVTPINYKGAEAESGQIIVGMPNQTYHKSNGVSSTGLKMLIQWSPAHFLSAQKNPVEQTKAMQEGNILHTMILEPSMLSKRYAFSKDWEGCKKPAWNTKPENWRPSEKRYMEAKRELAGKGIEVVDKSMGDFEAYSKAVRRHPKWKLLTGTEALFEASFFDADPETGLAIRVRPDLLNMTTWRGGERALVVDLKSARDQRERAFGRQVIDLAYDLSAAMYCEVVSRLIGKPCDWAWVVAPKTGGALPTIYTMSSAMRRRGEALYHEALELLKKCQDSGSWPGLNDDNVTELDPPEWATLDVSEYWQPAEPVEAK